MRRLRAWLMRLGGLFNKGRRDRELAEEIESHLQLHIDDALRSGLSAEEARRVALVKLGGIESLREQYRDRLGIPLLETMMQDLRYGLRMLRRSPAFSAVAILSLALGIGANTAIFSILDSLLLRPLPVKNPEQLALVAQDEDRDSWTYPIWEQVRDREHLFAGTAAWSINRFNTAPSGQTEHVDGLWVNGSFFDVLGVPAIRGRTLTEADDRRGGGPDGPVAVISHKYWQKRFGGAADAVGKSITLDRVPFTVIGVTPPDFFGPDVGRTFDVAAPFGAEPLIRGRDSMLDIRSAWWLTVLLRRKPDQSLEQATAVLRGIQSQIREATLPQNLRQQDQVQHLRTPLVLLPAAHGASYLRYRYQRPLTTIMVVVGLVLLIACANIANLLLVRAGARRHELSVRLALGASRLRLARQLLVESLLLSSCGALLGLLFAQWGSRLLLRQLSTRTNVVFLDLSLDWRVLAFTAAAAIGTAILFGTAPALRATRVEPIEALKAQGRGIVGEGRMGLGNLLVVLQVALSLVLVVSAGMFLRTFAKLSNQNLGFDPDRVLIAHVAVLEEDVRQEQRPAFFERLREAASTAPGVASAAASKETPVSGSTSSIIIEIPGGPSLPENERRVLVHTVSRDFFKTYGTQMILGRDFTEADKAGAPPVVIVNQTFARRFMNGGDPIGRTLRQPARPDRPAVTREIVGYVADAFYRNLRQAAPPTIYIPLAQRGDLWSAINISVRAAAGSPALLTRAVASALNRTSPNLSITFRPLAEQVNNSLIQERLVATLSGFFGALALLLAGIGLYGVTSYTASRRRTEISIRMALGAAPASVVRLVLRRVTWLVLAGVIAGGAVALWAARFVETLLYGLTPRDPATLAGAAAVLTAVAAIAGLIPAWRASRIDPAKVLREG